MMLAAYLRAWEPTSGTCLICETDFDSRTWGHPAMPCDCGRNLSHADDPAKLARYRAAWRNAESRQDWAGWRAFVEAQ